MMLSNLYHYAVRGALTLVAATVALALLPLDAGVSTGACTSTHGRLIPGPAAECYAREFPANTGGGVRATQAVR
jgi:hypothetical protein